MTRSAQFPAAVGLFACLVALPSAASAKDPPAEPHAAAFHAVLDCRKTSDNAARLACFDAAATKLGQAQSQGDIVVVDRAQATAAHRQAFGLPLPSLDFMTRALKPDEADHVDGVIRTFRADASGRWTMALEDGAVWRQIDGALLRPPRVGAKVSIRKGVLGSFLIKVDGQPAVKAHRDQ